MRRGRNYKEIIKEWQFITQELKADIKILDMSLLDTTLHKDLIRTFISDLILQVLAYVAEQERINIKKRQVEGSPTNLCHQWCHKFIVFICFIKLPHSV